MSTPRRPSANRCEAMSPSAFTEGNEKLDKGVNPFRERKTSVQANTKRKPVVTTIVPSSRSVTLERSDPSGDNVVSRRRAVYTDYLNEDAPPGIFRLRAEERDVWKPKKHCWLKHFSVLFGIALFFLLANLAIVILAVNITLYHRALLRTWTERIEAGHLLAFNEQLTADTYYQKRLSIAMSTMLRFGPGLNFEEKDSTQKPCRLLDKVDNRKMFTRSINVGSTYDYQGCNCGRDDVDALDALFARHSINGTISPHYRVNRSNYLLVEPLEVFHSYLHSNQNASEVIKREFGENNEFFDTFLEYMNASNIPKYPNGHYWKYNVPHVAICVSPYFPTAELSSNPALQQLKPNYVFTRSVLNEVMNKRVPFNKNETLFRIALLALSSINTSDPIVSVNNWDQPVVNNASTILFNYIDSLSFLHVSNISDPLMRTAMKHVNLSSFRDPSDFKVYNKTFRYRGNYAVVSWYRTISDRSGYEACVVHASARFETTGSLLAYEVSIIVATTAVCFVLTFIVTWLVDELYMKPLREIKAALLNGGEWKRRKARVLGLDGPVVIRENYELFEVYNDAVGQLRAVEEFLPQVHRTGWKLRYGESISQLGKQLFKSSSLTLDQLCARGNEQEFRYKTCVYVLCSSYDENSAELFCRAAAEGDLDRNPGALGVTRKGLETALQKLFDVLASCAKTAGGVEVYLSPEQTIFHFGSTPAEDVRPAAMEERKANAQRAVRFALRLARRLHELRSKLCPCVVVDSTLLLEGTVRVSEEQSVFVTYGRNVAQDLRDRLEDFDPEAVLVTEDTRQLLDDRVQLWPAEAISMQRNRARPYSLMVFEAWGEAPASELWTEVYDAVLTAFGQMIRGDYERAYDALRELKDAYLDGGREGDVFEQHSQWSSVSGATLREAVLPRPFRARVGYLLAECERKMDEGFGKTVVRMPIPLRYRYLLCETYGDRVVTAAVEDGCSTCSVSAASTLDALYEDVTLSQAAEYEFHCISRVPGTNKVVFRVSPVHAGKDSEAERRFLSLVSMKTAGLSVPLYNQVYPLLSSGGDLCVISVLPLLYDASDMGYYLSEREEMLSADRIPNEVERALARMAPKDTYVVRRSDVHPPPVPAWWRDRSREIEWLIRPNDKSPSLVSVLGYEVGFDVGCAIIQEFYPGGNLREVRERYGPPALPALRKYVLSMLEGLMELHDTLGIVHGFLTPKNVLAGIDGNCRLQRFFRDPARARELFLLEDTCYVGPEMATEGSACYRPAFDLFCLGLVVVELVTGALPWRWSDAQACAGRTARELDDLLRVAGDAFLHEVSCGGVVVVAPLPPLGDERLDKVLRVCLRQDPERRWPARKCHKYLKYHK